MNVRSLKKLIISLCFKGVVCLLLGAYLGLQIAYHDRVGTFTLVPSLEKMYYQMFMEAIDEPNTDWSKAIDIGEGNGPMCKNKDMACITDINSWVNDNITYVSDDEQYGGEYFAKPSQIVKSMADDCDGSAALKYALLRLNNFTPEEVNFLGVGFQEIRFPNHAVVGVTLDGIEYDLDINYPYPIQFKDTENKIFERMSEKWYKKENNFWEIW